MTTMTDTKQTIEIAIGGTHRGKAINQKMPWEEFCGRLETPKVDHRHSVADYKALDADAKAAAKKTGFFAGGPSLDGNRNHGSIVARSILTLDLDKITDADLAAGIRGHHIPGLDCESFIYTTRSHDPEAPRIRILAPLARLVDEQEYSALSRIVASRVDPCLTQTDSSSSLIAQIMYLPSISRDQEYIAFRQDGPVLDPDVLLEGVDLNDGNAEAVPLYPQERTRRISRSEQLGDPRAKAGLVGAFCRAYSIEGAMGAFLPGVYVPTSEEGRYTYTEGSTSGGAKVYGDYLHSWHSTDPCAGLSVNAYDLVRLHLFGDRDNRTPADTPYAALPSQTEMRKFAMSHHRVVAELPEEDRPVTAESFLAPAKWDLPSSDANTPEVSPVDSLIAELDADIADAEVPVAVPEDALLADAEAFLTGEAEGAEPEAGEDEDEDPDAWKEALDYERIEGKAGKRDTVRLKPGSYNAGVILSGDPRMKGVLAFDEVRSRTVIRKPLDLDFPGATGFTTDARGTELNDTMINVMWAWMQAPDHVGGYGFKPTHPELKAAIDVTSARSKYNPILDMINAVEWDGKKRMGSYLIRYLGCDDNVYTRKVGKLILLGMIARAIKPGAKFDFVPVLEGTEGLGKSTFVRALSGDFYSSVAKGDMRETKRLLDKVNASWVVEMPELAVFVGEDPKQVAALITETADQERRAYAHFSERYLRRTIFVGTTNEKQYLTKRTGNRRFWPITIRRSVDLRAFQAELPQLYAEALAFYRVMKSKTYTAKDGTVQLRYPGDLPLFIRDRSTAGRIAAGLQLSRLTEQTEDSVLGAAIGILTTEVEDLQHSGAFEHGILDKIEKIEITEVSDKGEPIATKSYLGAVPIWPLHDAIFPEMDYHARQSPLATAVPQAHWTSKGRTIRTGSAKYGQQVFYKIDVSALLNTACIELGEKARCEDGIMGTIEGIAAYRARIKAKEEERA